MLLQQFFDTTKVGKIQVYPIFDSEENPPKQTGDIHQVNTSDGPNQEHCVSEVGET